MPSRDRVVLDAVPAAGRRQLLDRLEAVWRAEQGEPLGPLADLAGLKRAAFYNLRVAWRAHSLAGLVPHDTRSGRRVDVGDDSPLRKEAETLLRANPLSRNVDVARAMIDANPELVPDDAGPNHGLTVLQRLQRLVGDERRRLTADAAFVRAAYGGELVLDLTAVQIVLDGAERSLAVAAILMETASGIVLGSALGMKDDGRSLQRDALIAGLSFLSLNSADLPPLRDVTPGLGWMLPPDIEPDSLVGLVEPHVGELMAGRAGGFSFGQQVLQIVGPRIGRTPLNPRRTLTADMEIDEYLKRRVAPVVTLKEARAIWAREVERHNADRVSALTKAGIVSAGVPDGRLAAVIRAVLTALQPA
ncbi:hypothetical protein [uncultured Sphingomonas sp.]|uniref:hypothetical protein n=1 Tax=uncultured Sphingomonas sp. TaxID=158754 RepID=UPI0035C97A71